ncbi:surfeit locus protein 2 isoform X3 [Selaginella moellendorffii]|uniref:surfeit locus protein 2 isoform X3 n=1 Tax=Selaginella moellendorffii TaxID=88036 RepID=UPI000D1CCEF5|nr:surfeit locus protein 2 isoform X3 [Selaginella moellendorffii]|eukprot:XP_024529154.1 surfeit locus protein 2 isoform X3 [Selaginella moellendorffii]
MAAPPETPIVGEPTFVAIVGQRFRCVETGHEMPAAEKEGYGSSKKCRDALFDRALQEGRAPLNFFQQSPEYRDKMICKLTGALVNKNEKAVWKHVLGKSFNKKLSAQEEKQNSKPSQPDVEHEMEDEGVDNEDMDFWIPPEVDGSDAEVDTPDADEHKKTKGKTKKSVDGDQLNRIKTKKEEKPKRKEKLKKKKHGFAVDETEDAMKVNKEQKAGKRKEKKPRQKSDDLNDEADEDETQIRMKRLALAVGPSSFASRKKKRKTES